MAMTSIGDLAQSHFFQLRATKLKSEQNRLTQELATGQVADVKSKLAGNVSYLAGIERDLKSLSSYSVAATEAQQFTGAVQSALGRVYGATSDMSKAILGIGSSTVHSIVTQVSSDAKTELTNTISALNNDIAGRSLFAGAATNVAPIISSEAFLNAVRNVAITGSGPDDIFNQVETWFADPAGYDTVAYQGSTDDLPVFNVNADTALGSPIRADDAEIKDVLMHMALAALAADPALGLDEAKQRELLKKAGDGLLNAQDTVVRLQGSTGFVEQRIEQASARNQSERTALEFAKGTFLQADPYETATNLENVQFQLQSLYQITVRMSDLSLGNFLR